MAKQATLAALLHVLPAVGPRLRDERELSAGPHHRRERVVGNKRYPFASKPFAWEDRLGALIRANYALVAAGLGLSCRLRGKTFTLGVWHARHCRPLIY